MKYADLKKTFEVGEEYTTITFNDMDIKIRNYIPRSEAYDLLMITAQESREGAIYNPLKLTVYFNVNVILTYTDIEFTAEDKQNKDILFDEMYHSGLLEVIINKISDYTDLFNGLNELISVLEKNNLSVSGLLQGIVNDLPAQAEAAQKIIDGFDETKYQKVLDFAKAANGGRDLPLSQGK